MMKFLFYILLIGCSIIFVSCSDKSFTPTQSSNPWSDDYSAISDMENYRKWGTYNVHDPSCLLIGDTYYMYSTDAIYKEDSTSIKKEKLPFGYIQIRKSKDLINWEFAGWVFNEIPTDGKKWVLDQSGGKGATNIWAPYILEHNGKYRLYYCISAFAMQTSYIGLAESNSPEGPWELKGCVTKSKTGDNMNAIDPGIVTNPDNGEQWMHYGSYFGGLYCVQLNPETGLTLKEGDQGHLTARRFNGKKNNIEAPEIIYNPDLKKYFLFVSYDPLMTTYNIRVGQSDKPEGPFTDFFGNDMRDETDNYPILTYPYQFKNHTGWSGTGHCGVFKDNKGDYYMAHQARLSPQNHMMVLHIRKIFWTDNGWPVVSPERFDNTQQTSITEKDLIGNWEIIIIHGEAPERDLEAGQILWGENILRDNEKNGSEIVSFNEYYKMDGAISGKWLFNSENNTLTLKNRDSIKKLKVFWGQDWENEKRTLLFTGLNDSGYTVWGKRVK